MLTHRSMDRRAPWSKDRSPAARAALISAAALVLLAGTAIAQRTAAQTGAGGGGAAASAAPAPRAPKNAQADLPLRVVTLYRSGVGAFLREGQVRGQETISLQFNTDQVNDILKSMVVLDLDGGKVDAVTFGSKQPLARRLEAFGIDISRSPSIEDLLKQLAGERIELITADGRIAGTIMSVERRTVPVASPSGDAMLTMQRAFVNLWTEGGLRSVEIDSVRTFELANKSLADDLGRALATLAEFRGERRTGVDVHLSGQPETPRRIVIGYTHEMPVWKTSYRLVLPEPSGAAEIDENGIPLTKATVQGWAIVENTTDQDWNGIRLSLASGRPVSFTMNLHESLFMPRIELPVPVGIPLAGKTHAAGLPQSPAMSLRSRRGTGGPSDEMDAMAAQSALTLAERAVTLNITGEPGGPEFFSSGVAIDPSTLGSGQASGEDTGGQFLYTVNAPVSIARGQSSMLPIIVTEIPARHVSIFNPNDMPKHPMKGIELINTTGLHLMPGPIAVYDGNTYAGDSQIPHTSRNQNRLLSFALDVDVFVERETTEQRRTSRIRVVDGLLEHTIRRSMTTTYSLKSYDAARERIVLIEHPKTDGWELISPPAARETVAGMQRFEVTVPRAGAAQLPVVIERTDLNRITLANWTTEQFLNYVSSNNASPRLIEAARDAARIQADINLIRNQVRDINERMHEISRDQSRIRENLSRIGGDSDLRRRYMTTLNEQENEMESLIQRRDALQKSLADREEALRQFLRNLDVE